MYPYPTTIYFANVIDTQLPHMAGLSLLVVYLNHSSQYTEFCVYTDALVPPTRGSYIDGF